MNHLQSWPEPVVRVQALSESGLTKIPDRYIKPITDRPSPKNLDDTHIDIPVIDLQNLPSNNQTLQYETLSLISSACKEWGFFQVVNHGVSHELMKQARETLREFSVGAASSFRVLDMVIISAKDLKQVNLFFKMDVFALASIQGYNNNLYNSLQKTPIDKDGGSNPIGNLPMKFLIDVVAAENNCLTLVIKLKADGSFGDKDIGEVHVPIKELLDKYGASNDEMHASYNVRTTRAGKFKGVLNFSFKFGDAVAAAPGPSVAAPPTPGGYSYPLAPGNGGYPYPLAPGYGGYPLPQMQPQEETSKGCQYCFIKHTNSPKSSYTGCYLLVSHTWFGGVSYSVAIIVLNFVQRQTLHESFQSQWLVQICIL